MNLKDGNQYLQAHYNSNYQIWTRPIRPEAVVKRKILSSIYPEKLIFSKKSFRTPKLNPALEIMLNKHNHLQAPKNEQAPMLSRLVSGSTRSDTDLELFPGRLWLTSPLITGLKQMYELREWMNL